MRRHTKHPYRLIFWISWVCAFKFHFFFHSYYLILSSNSCLLVLFFEKFTCKNFFNFLFDCFALRNCEVGVDELKCLST